MLIAVPTMTGIMGGSKVAVATEIVAGALSSARQLAVSANRDVEFRLITMRDPAFLSTSTPQIRALQVLEVTEGQLRPLSRPRLLPDGVIIGSGTGLTSLADLDDVAAAATDSRISGIGTTYTYRSFRFRPDGSLNLKMRLEYPNDDKYYFTIHDERSPPSGDTPPPNFATFRLEPSTGAYTVYRP
jgi:uncharacterized protein (TIGR02596 family)